MRFLRPLPGSNAYGAMPIGIIESYSMSVKYLIHYPASDVGEAHVEPLVAEGEAAVVKAEEVQQGGVEVVGVHGVLRDAPAEVVRGADHLTALDPDARQPDGEGVRVMVTPGAVEVGPLRDGGAAKLRAADHQ